MSFLNNGHLIFLSEDEGEVFEIDYGNFESG